MTQIAEDTIARTELGSPAFWARLASDPKALAVEVCTIDLVDLERTLYQHPGLRAWVGVACEDARVAKSRAEWNVKRSEAQAFITAKGELDEQTKKPKNADTCKAEATLSPAVEVAMLALFAADEKYGAFRAMTSALEERSQMLVQISARRRQEARDGE